MPTTTYNSGSGNFTVPAGVTSLLIEGWGSGGGGGGGGNGGGSGAGGGGGGGYFSKTVTVTPGDLVAYSVGAAAGTQAGLGAGNNGNATTVSTFSLTANGGNGGGSGQSGGAGGSGGTASGGTTNTTGTNGSNQSGGTGGNGGAGANGGAGGSGSPGTGNAPGGGGKGGDGFNGVGAGSGAGRVSFTYSVAIEESVSDTLSITQALSQNIEVSETTTITFADFIYPTIEESLSSSLSLSDANIVDTFAYVSQIINLVDVANLVYDDALTDNENLSQVIDCLIEHNQTIEHTIGINDSHTLLYLAISDAEHNINEADNLTATTIFTIPITDTLNITQVVSGDELDVSTSNTLSLAQLTVEECIYFQTLSSTLSMTVDFSAFEAVSQSIGTNDSIICGGIYNQSIALSLDLTQFIGLNTEVNLTADNDLSGISDSVGYGESVSGLNNLSVSDDATIYREIPISVVDTLSITNTIGIVITYNLTTENTLGIVEDFDLTDAAGVTVFFISNNRDELVLTQSNNVNTTFNTPTSSSLTLSDIIAAYKITEDIAKNSINFTNYVQYIEIYDLEICDQILLTDRANNVIEVSATNDLNLSMIEIDGLTQSLSLTDSIVTNMENISCIRPGGFAPDMTNNDTLNLNQVVVANLVYNQTPATNLNLLNTVAWRI